MSIAGESIIKSASEALEFALGKENDFIAHTQNGIL
jgi:hypothetical protein